MEAFQQSLDALEAVAVPGTLNVLQPSVFPVPPLTRCGSFMHAGLLRLHGACTYMYARRRKSVSPITVVALQGSGSLQLKSASGWQAASSAQSMPTV
jgi:hypothetical protein